MYTISIITNLNASLFNKRYTKKAHNTYIVKNIKKKENIFTSAQPLFAVCVQGFGPQLVQETISFGTVVESLFLSP